MKILYLGLEWDGLTHGGEYEVLRPIPRPNGTCYVVLDDNEEEVFIQHYNAIAEAAGNEEKGNVTQPGAPAPLAATCFCVTKVSSSGAAAYAD